MRTTLCIDCCVIGVITAGVLCPSTSDAGIRAGATQCEITPEVGLEIQHYFRISVGVHDPLYARCLYLEDDQANSVVMICLDLIFADFEACDSLRAEICEQTGIEHALINFSHSHSAVALGPRGRSTVSNDTGSKWNDETLDAILEIVKEAKLRAEEVDLSFGRASSHVGFNRRLINDQTGEVYMGVNHEGAVVPWVNVFVANSTLTGRPVSVLFETAAHPVIVPDTTKKISADYPGAAVRRIREVLGADVIAMFGQGCCGNINGFPLRSSYENAVKQGRDLGDNVLQAIEESQPIDTECFEVKGISTKLPSRPLPTHEEWTQMVEKNRDDPRRMKQLDGIRDLIIRGEDPPARRLDVWALMFGDEWCLTTLPHEMFCQYELWIDENAPFKRTMTFGYTNGYEGYIAVDAALRMGAKGGYEAGSLPNWGGQVYTRHFGPPAVGCERIIKDAVASLWQGNSSQDAAEPIRPARDAPQPKSPAESAACIELPKGFRIDLVAREPLIQDPSCIAFDERGRLFVCELHGYNIEGHIDVTEFNKTGKLDTNVRRIRWELMDGRIAKEAASQQYGVVKLLTDTDNDGLMDRADVWAERLPPCYGLLPARGGIIVVCAPDIVFLADHDNDGRPEVRQTLFSGFRKQFMERGINNPRWGVDNWIYVGAGGQGGTIHGPNLADSVELQQSDFRIKPDGSAIEPVTGRVATFGLTINDTGDRFPSSGSRPAMYALPLPWRFLTRNSHVPTPETNQWAATYERGFRISRPHPWRVRRQQDPAWVKFYGAKETNSNFFSGGCSNEFYGDTLFPREYRGNIFYCEPSLNIVHRCLVTRDGAGYSGQRTATEQQSEFLASKDQWFRPMNLRVGPDGALYIVDMYREIIEDYSAIPRFLQQQYGLNRGADRGRIWRLVPRDAARRESVDFTRLSNAELVRVLNDTSPWRRLTAQRLLIERNAVSAADALAAVLRETTLPQAEIYALHTLNALGQLRPADIVHAACDEHYAVRVHALRLAGPWLGSDESLLTQVVEMIGDDDPAVRLQLAMTLGESDAARAGNALLKLAVRHGTERWMPAAVLSSARDHADQLLHGLLREKNTGNLASALIRPLAATVVGCQDVPAIVKALTLIPELEESLAIACLQGFVEGTARTTAAFPESVDGWTSVTQLLRSKSPRVRRLATQLASRIPLADRTDLIRIFTAARQQALDHDRALNERLEALALLANASWETLAPVSVRLLDTRQHPVIQQAAVSALGTSDDKRAGAALLTGWPGFTPQVREAVLRQVFAHANRLPALLDAMENDFVRREELIARRQEQLTSSGDPQLAARAERLLANPNASAELQQRIDRYQQALDGPRDIERGKQVFAKHCLTCHKLRNEGYDVGPQLGTIINKPDETILLDLLDPSSRIEPEYQSYIVATFDGRTFTGILASDSPTSVTLRREKDETDSILRADIDLIRSSEVSQMPSNLHETISPRDAADLIGYMREAFGRTGKK